MKRGVLAKPESFYDRFERKGDDDLASTHYCAGCGHGIVQKLLAEAIDDLGIADRTILVSPVGCAVFAYYYLHVGNVQAAHGRAPAVATALKRAHPHAIVICYQGDGDLAAIGSAEILHAANRGEPFTVFFVNNAIYGMTGGQMAPTTLLGQHTTTSPAGRAARGEGAPLRVCELLATLAMPAYLERCALGDAPQISRTRAAIRKALRCQMEGRGFSLVEILSMCPTAWHVTPVEAQHFVRDEMTHAFPLGVRRDEHIDVHQYEEKSPASPRAPGERDAPEPRSDAVASCVERTPPLSPDALRALLAPEAELEAHATVAERPAPEARILVAGSGGQGVLFLGTVLAKAGMRAGAQVSWIPSYGPEMRGGTAHCHVVLSARRVGSPYVTHPTALVAMNGPSLERFAQRTAEGGIVIYDASIVHTPPLRSDVRAFAIPCARIAAELGAPAVANMVALGALWAIARTLPKELLLSEAGRSANERMRGLHVRAFDAGAEVARTLEEARQTSPQTLLGELGPVVPA
jgi:2-oxoisovalerate ferredoxin oxidoreductase beta subunit